jgi:asparagine synthase (glutamine-hydrolysing)
MCGIAGIYAYHPAAPGVDRAELRRIRDHMTARGPDACGEWYAGDGRVGLGHRRLSIIDLSGAASQPMMSADGHLVVALNGEIYNYKELRHDLAAKGRVFRTQSDTEVLLHLYAECGEAMVRRLRGMYAFALWDAGQRRLVLARDPYGIKPLYVADDGRTLRFASQVKALLAGGAVPNEADAAGWAGFNLFGSVPEPHTVYRAIRAVPAGVLVTIDTAGAQRPRRHFSIAEVYCQAEAEAEPLRWSAGEVQERARAALIESVRLHLAADVPVGAFLSGGVDSGALVGLMRDAGQQEIQTVTLAFEEFRGRREDEAGPALQVAQRYATRHVTRVVGEGEFRDDLPKILAAMDQPTIDGINCWFVSKAARELGLKVVISGLGGDELLGGYSTFRTVPRWVRWLRAPSQVAELGDAFRRLTTGMRRLAPGIHPKASGLVTYGGTFAGAYLLSRGLFMPWEIDHLVDRETMVGEGMARLRPLDHIGQHLQPCPATAFAKVATLESALYMRNQLLRDADWAGMAHSLEVRVPLVDSELVRRLAPIMTAAGRPDGKILLSRSPRVPLPAGVTGRRKTGFAIPIAEWAPRAGLIDAGAGGGLWGRSWARLVQATATTNCGVRGIACAQ